MVLHEGKPHEAFGPTVFDCIFASTSRINVSSKTDKVMVHDTTDTTDTNDKGKKPDRAEVF